MLRRHSSKSRPNIKQRKSISPARSGVHLEHIDTDCAQRDATTAAAEAYARSQHRSNIDAPLFPPQIPQRLHQASQSAHVRTQPLRPSNSGQSGLRRQQSVRFVANQPGHVDVALERAGSLRSANGGSAAPWKNANHAGYARDSLAGGEVLQQKENMKPAPITFAGEEHSAFSSLSYRRLKRSKSIMSPVASDKTMRTDKGMQVDQIGGQAHDEVRDPSAASNLGTAAVTDTKTEIRSSGTRSLRAPKSMSFLGSRQEWSQAEPTMGKSTWQEGGRPESVFSQRTGISGRLKPASSMLFRSGSLRSTGADRRPLRTSMREGLNENIPPAIGNSGVSWHRESSLTDKARKASKSLKSKIKTLFGRGKKDEALGPLDHRPCDNAEDEGAHEVASAQITIGEEGRLSRVSSRVASVQTVVQDHALRSRHGSVKSLRSECQVSDQISRATSWASSGHSTVASQQAAWSDWQQQRLSVITENGGTQLAGMSTVINSHEGAAATPASDDKRVYSALAKRLTERQQQAEAGAQARTGERSISEHQPATDGSIHRTIRCVAASTETLWKPETDLEVGGRTAVLEKPNLRWTQSWTSLDSMPVEVGPRICEIRGSTPDLPSLGLPRSDRSSAFFGSPSCHLFRTASPYRRAIQESMKAAGASRTPPKPSRSPLGRMHDERQADGRGSETGQEEQAYSESAYSGGEDTDSSRLEATEADDIASNTLKAPEQQLSRFHSGMSSESVDWKTWLAANVSKLEMQPSPGRQMGRAPENQGYPSHGHKREATQIYDENGNEENGCEEEEGGQAGECRLENQRAPTAEAQVNPLCPVQPNVARSMSQQGRQTSLLAENQAPRSAAEATAGNERPVDKLARARSLNRIRTSGDGSPIRQQTPASVRLVRRTEMGGSVSPTKAAGDKAAIYGDGGEPGGATASRRMVDLFLSSRRRRMASSDDGKDAFV